MTIREIDSRLLELTDPETGELLDYDRFMELQMERSDKLEGMALWVKELRAQAAAIKEEISVLTERKKAAERRADRLLEYLSWALNGEKFSTPRCEVTFRRSAALEVDDPDALIRWAQTSGYDGCVRYKPPEVSKSAVTELLKSGVEVPHARMIQKLNIGVK